MTFVVEGRHSSGHVGWMCLFGSGANRQTQRMCSQQAGTTADLNRLAQLPRSGDASIGRQETGPEGDVARFCALPTAYRKTPEVARRRIPIETLQDGLPQGRSRIIVHDCSQASCRCSSAIPLSASWANPEHIRRL